jgi:hypothetical protein
MEVIHRSGEMRRGNARCVSSAESSCSRLVGTNQIECEAYTPLLRVLMVAMEEHRLIFALGVIEV